MAGFAFNIEPIIAYMEQKATRGVMAATAIAVKHAQRHAPVRKIFRGTSYRTTARGFRAPINRRARDIEQGQQRIGHANSLFPVFRSTHNGEKSYISGDFRRVGTPGRLATIGTGFKAGDVGKVSGAPALYDDMKKGTAYEVPGSQTPQQLAVFVHRGGRLQMQDPSKVKPVSAEGLRAGKQSILSSRGRYEVRSGRANFTSPDDGVTRVGGRLRGEIHAEGPTTHNGVIWGYVVSATKDPETGRLYPRDQEFGNAHNRPHPFLRPGLQDSRGALKREMRDAIRLGRQ